MKFIFSRLKKDNIVKVKMQGDSLELLTLLIPICCSLGETISKDKNISYDNAIKLITESIQEGYKITI